MLRFSRIFGGLLIEPTVLAPPLLHKEAAKFEDKTKKPNQSPAAGGFDSERKNNTIGQSDAVCDG